MTGIIPINLWPRVRLDGDVIQTIGDVTQTQQLEAWTTVVTEFQPVGEPTLTPNMPVHIDQVDFINDERIAQFGGFLNIKGGVGQPRNVVLQAQGPMQRLRRVATSDHVLSTFESSVSDGVCVKYVLDQCNVPYDDADIADAEYILGDKVDVIWRKDQPGWAIIRELDQVFGMATLEIGDGRVVRFPYDKAPSSDFAYRTYTKGSDADFFYDERHLWDNDQVQNSWVVTGATWQTSKCDYTVWARASAANDAFESDTVRVASQPFQSDIIQDEALAREVAKRMMRWYNRQPDVVRIDVLNDPNINPGSVVILVDSTFGIDHSIAAPYLVLTVDRSGRNMSLNCIGGAAGDEGTVTSGVEKRCNKTTSDVDVPGSFTPLDIGAIPITDPIDYDCSTDGGPEGLCLSVTPADETCSLIDDAGWDIVSGGWTLDSDEITNAINNPGVVSNYRLDLDDKNWQMSGTLKLGQRTAVVLGLESTSGGYQWAMRLGTKITHLSGHVDTPRAIVLIGPDESVSTPEGHGWKPDVDLNFLMTYNDTAHILTAEVSQGSRDYFLALDGTDLGTDFGVFVETSQDDEVSSSSSQDFTTGLWGISPEGGCIPAGGDGGGDDLTSGPWTIIGGAWSTPGTLVSATSRADSYIYHTAPVDLVAHSDGIDSFTITYSVDMRNENLESILTIAKDVPGLGLAGGIAAVVIGGKTWHSALCGVPLNERTLYALVGDSETCHYTDLASLSLSDVWDVLFTWDRATSHYTVTVEDQHSHSSSIDTTDGDSNTDAGSDDLYLLLTSHHLGASEGDPGVEFTELVIVNDEA